MFPHTPGAGTRHYVSLVFVSRFFDDMTNYGTVHGLGNLSKRIWGGVFSGLISFCLAITFNPPPFPLDSQSANLHSPPSHFTLRGVFLSTVHSTNTVQSPVANGTGFFGHYLRLSWNRARSGTYLPIPLYGRGSQLSLLSIWEDTILGRFPCFRNTRDGRVPLNIWPGLTRSNPCIQSRTGGDALWPRECGVCSVPYLLSTISR